MDNFSIVVFVITSLSLLGGAVWLMFSAANSKPVRDYNAGRLSGTWTTAVKKAVHPEMVDVKDGDELMGVTFKSCDIEEYNELQERINQLQNKLEDPWEDEDDDGGAPVPALR